MVGKADLGREHHFRSELDHEAQVAELTDKEVGFEVDDVVLVDTNRNTEETAFIVARRLLGLLFLLFYSPSLGMNASA